MADEETAEQQAQEVAATAAARAHADALGIDLSQVGGTGKGGAVTKADIEAAIAARPELTGGASTPTVTASGDAAVVATVTQDAANGMWAVDVTINHGDQTLVRVDGRAVWVGTR